MYNELCLWYRTVGQHLQTSILQSTVNCIIMIIISSPIYGRHNEVGGYRVLPQILVPHVAKPSHHLVLSPGQGEGDHHWFD